MVLVYFVRRRKDLPFSWMFWLFAAFIVGCGTTHLLEVVTTYTPVYRLAGLIKLLTAAVSVLTGVALVPLVPRALLLRGPAELQQEVEERRGAQEVAERQAALLDLAHDGVLVRDLQSRVVYWNRGAEVMYGWGRGEALGRVSHQFLHTEFPRPLREIEEDVYRAGRWDGELVHTCKDGAKLVVASRWALRRDAEGRPEAILEINRDITQRRLAEAALQQAHDELEQRVGQRTAELGAANETLRAEVAERRRVEDELRRVQEGLEERVRERTAELQRSNQELEQFAYVASHDLQEPLRMVGSYLELLAQRYKGQLDERADKYIHYAVDGATRMQGLIQDLLAYSRITAAAWRPESIDLGAALRVSLRHLKKAIEEAGAEVTADPLPTVPADPTQLTQVFQNLIGNALKFCETRPACVHVGCERRAAEWVLSVRDNGIGIAPEHAQRIFQLFQRLHQRGKYPGTGIGLAVCKKVVERHRGRIWVESAPGEGSTFYFTLPAEVRAYHDEQDEGQGQAG